MAKTMLQCIYIYLVSCMIFFFFLKTIDLISEWFIYCLGVHELTYIEFLYYILLSLLEKNLKI